jgi:cystathionine beta-lyase/cystathionine gamma-synthase
VFYPGLPSHPRYELVRELFIKGGAGGMLAFEPCGGMEAAETLVKVGRVNKLSFVALHNFASFACVGVLALARCSYFFVNSAVPCM